VTVDDRDVLAQRFETHRQHLRAVAYRMLGSSHEADDAVQEAWLRLSRTDADTVDNLGGWLTTVVSRVCLDMLRARANRPEALPDSAPDPVSVTSPEDEALLADSVGLALLVVLDTLVPAERLAFVLHDIFAVSFEEIASIVGRTPVAARQLASRARRRVQSDPAFPNSPVTTQREVVTAFLAAAREGDFAALLRLLDPDVVVRADAVAIGIASARADAGAPELSAVMHGVDAVTRVFAGGAKAARLAIVDGLPGAVVSVGGRPMAVFDFTVRGGRVVGIELLADPETLGALDLELVRGAPSLRGSLKESGLVEELEADHRHEE
jgi:RNA polymerase sigma-70 factor (ECF subfamily)